MATCGGYPCPHCSLVTNDLDLFYNHVLQQHSITDLANILGGAMLKELTKKDFTQVDSHWMYVVNGFHLSLAPDERGEFKLMVYGSIEPIPAATMYPTEPEWETALKLANKFIEAYAIATKRR